LFPPGLAERVIKFGARVDVEVYDHGRRTCAAYLTSSLGIERGNYRTRGHAGSRLFPEDAPQEEDGEKSRADGERDGGKRRMR